MSKASGQKSTSQQLHRKYLHTSLGTRISRQMQESVAVANAAELFKLIFLSKSTAPEAPTLLAKTLRRYSEHDLFAAFNYLREKKIMVSRIHVLLMAVAWHQMDEWYDLEL